MKRATDCGTVFDADEVISIHALVKRATTDVFNWWVGIDISIHALVKRATAVFRKIC